MTSWRSTSGWRSALRRILRGSHSYSSATTYDLTSSHARVEVLRSLSTPDSYALLAASNSVGCVYIAVMNGKLVCMQQLASTYTALARIPYDPVLHRWWQFQECEGLTYWEVSSDGQSWITVFSKSSPLDLTAVNFNLGTRLLRLRSPQGQGRGLGPVGNCGPALNTTRATLAPALGLASQAAWVVPSAPK